MKSGRRPPALGVECSPPTASGEWGLGVGEPAVTNSRLLAPTVVRVHLPVPPFSRTCCQFFTLVNGTAFPERGQAAAIASTPATRAPAVCRIADRFPGGGPGGDDVVDDERPRRGGRWLPAAPDRQCCARVRPCRARRNHGRAPCIRKRLTTVIPGWSRTAAGQPGDRIAATSSGGRATGRRGHDRQRDIEHPPRQQVVNAGGKRMGRRCDEVGAAMFLQCDDRLPRDPA